MGKRAAVTAILQDKKNPFLNEEPQLCDVENKQLERTVFSEETRRLNTRLDTDLDESSKAKESENSAVA